MISFSSLKPLPKPFRVLKKIFLDFVKLRFKMLILANLNFFSTPSSQTPFTLLFMQFWESLSCPETYFIWESFFLLEGQRLRYIDISYNASIKKFTIGVTTCFLKLGSWWWFKRFFKLYLFVSWVVFSFLNALLIHYIALSEDFGGAKIMQIWISVVFIRIIRISSVSISYREIWASDTYKSF